MKQQLRVLEITNQVETIWNTAYISIQLPLSKKKKKAVFWSLTGQKNKTKQTQTDVYQ